MGFLPRSNIVGVDYFSRDEESKIFASSNPIIKMRNKNYEFSEDSYQENSENVLENFRYIKMLELQRSVLNKLVESTSAQISPQSNDTRDAIECQ